MINKLWIVIILMLVFGFAQADENTKLTNENLMVLHEVWRAIKIKDTMGNYLGYELTEINGLADPSLQPVISRIIREESQKILDKNAGMLYESLVPAYLQYFTEKELIDLAAFYQSDLGKKAFGLQGVMAEKVMSNAQHWREKMQPEIVKHVYKTLLKSEEIKNNKKYYDIVKKKLNE